MIEESLIADARIVLQEGKVEEAMTLLSRIERPGEEVFYLRGEIEYNRQRWGAAQNNFQEVLRINPANKGAENYIVLIQGILSFFHSDQFNP